MGVQTQELFANPHMCFKDDDKQSVLTFGNFTLNYAQPDLERVCKD